MNRVSIGYSKPKKWKIFAQLIMLIEGTNYSHTFVTWKCTNIDRRKIFEAVGAGIRILSNIVFKQHAEVVEVYDFYVDDETLFRIEQKAHDLTGRKYGYKALLGLMIMRLTNFLYRVIGSNKKVGNPFKDGDYSQVCVEASGMVLQEILKKKINDEDWGLRESNAYVAANAEGKADQERIDKINGVI